MSGLHSRDKEPGEFDRLADHGPVAGVDVDEVKYRLDAGPGCRQ